MNITEDMSLRKVFNEFKSIAEGYAGAVFELYTHPDLKEEEWASLIKKGQYQRRSIRDTYDRLRRDVWDVLGQDMHPFHDLPFKQSFTDCVILPDPFRISIRRLKKLEDQREKQESHADR